MKASLHIIHEKIEAIQAGLLRYNTGEEKITLHGHIKVDTNESLHYITDEVPMENLLHKDVTLVQKDKDNYMYVDGRISKISGSKLSIAIRKACWFIRKRKGSVTSLQEKYIYEIPAVKLAS